MKITPALIRHLEALARLELSPKRRRELQGDLERILDYVAQLEELDTESVPPTAHVLEGHLANDQALREDVAAPSLPRSAALDQAPSQEDGFFVVPPVLGVDRDEDSGASSC